MQLALDGKSHLIVQQFVEQLLMPEDQLPGEHGRIVEFALDFAAQFDYLFNHIGAYPHAIIGGESELAGQVGFWLQ